MLTDTEILRWVKTRGNQEKACQFFNLQKIVKYDLSSSNLAPFSIQQLLELEPKAQENYLNLCLDYSPPQGETFLREEIAKIYSHLDFEDIFVESGSEEGIQNVIGNLGLENNHCIIQFPGYSPLIELVSDLPNADISLWHPSKKWAWHVDELERLIQPNTRAVFINFPHNPTGATLCDEELKKLIFLCEHHQIYLVSDEVYRFLEYDESTRLPLVADLTSWGISLGSLSKAYALPGLRIGWVATTSPQIHEGLMAVKSKSTLCDSIGNQFLAALCLRHSAVILAHNLKLVKTNLVFLEKFIEKHSTVFSWVPPQAGSICLLGLKNNQNSYQFTVDLAERAGVLVLPGILFYLEFPCIRISLGNQEFAKALQFFEAFLNSAPVQLAC